MAVKREIRASEIFEDLIVKLKNIYKDVYIFRYTFCVPGEDAPDSIVGDILCELEPTYKKAVEELFSGIECIYIPSVGNLREILKEFNNDPEAEYQYRNLDEEAKERGEISYFGGAVKIVTENLEDYLRFITGFEESFNDSKRTWSCIADNDALVATIYNDKAIFNLPIEKDGEEYVTIAKQLLPLITEKTVQNAFINVTKSESHEGLYEVLIDFRFTHFRMEAIYTMIPLPFE